MHETFYRSAIKDLKLFTTNLKGELTVVLSKKNIKNELKYKRRIKSDEKFSKKIS